MELQDIMSKNFPSSNSLIIFLIYVCPWQGMLVTASRQGGNNYPYNTVTVVLITEILKLLLSISIYMRNKTAASLVEGFLKGKSLMGLYFVPAGLYCIYNNLSFASLSFFNPMTYVMFLQIRLLMTGLIYQTLFSTSLNRNQWGSLLLLTMGCMIHAGGMANGNEELKSSITATSVAPVVGLGFGFLFIFTQVLCSVFARVFNEFLIKQKGADIDIMIHNMYMYIDSLICNMLLLGLKGDISSAFTSSALSSIGNPLVLALISNNAIFGIIASLFLQKLNSVAKAFASALELVLTALVSWLLLDVLLTLQTVTALVTISAATIIYAQDPIRSQQPEEFYQQP